MDNCITENKNVIAKATRIKQKPELSTPIDVDALSNELQKLRFMSAGPSLSLLTSHLPRTKLNRYIDPRRWGPIYLSALRIFVQNGMDTKIVLRPLFKWQFIVDDAPHVREFKQIISSTTRVETNKRTPYTLCIISMVIPDLVMYRRGWVCSARRVRKLVEYLLLHFVGYLQRALQGTKAKLNVLIKCKYGAPLHLTYRGARIIVQPSMSVHTRTTHIGDPPWSIPILAIMCPRMPTNDYAAEICMLLTMAQDHFLSGPRNDDPVDPYVLTIHATRITILTANIGIPYLESIEKMDVGFEGLKVYVSEEFDMMIMEHRVKFVAVFEELLAGLLGKAANFPKGWRATANMRTSSVGKTGGVFDKLVQEHVFLSYLAGIATEHDHIFC